MSEATALCLPVKDLALCLGLEASFRLIGQTEEAIRTLEAEDLYDLELHIKDYDPPTYEIKPHLRPLSDMTEKEEKMYAAGLIAATSAVTGGKKKLHFQAMWYARLTQELIQAELDVFNWIDKGLAIDKTKLK